MHNRFLLAGVLLSTVMTGVHAQRAVNLDSVSGDYSALRAFYSVAGQPVANVKFVRLTEGSPFFLKDWFDAEIYLKDGGRIRNLPIKLNLLDNRLHFLKDEGEFVAEKPIAEVRFSIALTGQEYTFRSGFPSTSFTSAETFFQVLSEGKVLLLKHNRKQVMESKPYSSATTEQMIKDFPSYYIFSKGEMIRLKNVRSELLTALEDQKDSIIQTIDSNKLNLKRESDLVQIVNYYNQIK